MSTGLSTDRQLACTPLHDWHAAQGARLVDFAGWSMPVQYTSIVEEHLATRHKVGLFDISHMGRLKISGPTATAYLDRLLTRRVTDMKPGQIRYSLVCSEAGGILDDILVYRLNEDVGQPAYMLVVNASNRKKIIQWLEDHTQKDISLEDQTLTTAMLAVQGPQAVKIVQDLFDWNLHALHYYTGNSVKLGNETCYLSRTGYTGEDGCEIMCDPQTALGIWEKLAAAALHIGGKVAGLAARDTLRLEAGMPLYGHELDESINPVQAGLAFAVNLRKRAFVGRDAIANIQSQGGQPVRVGLQLDSRRVAREGCQLLNQGKEIGTVTSGTFSPTFDRPIAMGYVHESVAAVGTPLEVNIRGQKQMATIVPLPFYQRSNT